VEQTTDGLPLTPKQAIEGLTTVYQRLIVIGQQLRDLSDTLLQAGNVFTDQQTELHRMYNTYESVDPNEVRYGD